MLQCFSCTYISFYITKHVIHYREITGDGKELFFDHGAPFFMVEDGEVMNIVSTWETRGLVAEWKANFGCFDQTSAKFVDLEKVCS